MERILNNRFIVPIIDEGIIELINTQTPTNEEAYFFIYNLLTNLRSTMNAGVSGKCGQFCTVANQTGTLEDMFSSLSVAGPKKLFSEHHVQSLAHILIIVLDDIVKVMDRYDRFITDKINHILAQIHRILDHEISSE